MNECVRERNRGKHAETSVGERKEKKEKNARSIDFNDARGNTKNRPVNI